MKENEYKKTCIELNNEDLYYKMSIPLLNDEELLEVDKNWQYLVDKYMMMTLKEREQLIAQYVMKKQKEEIERLHSIINEALRKLRASKDHFKTQQENNAVTFTIRILDGSEKE